MTAVSGADDLSELPPEAPASAASTPRDRLVAIGVLAVPLVVLAVALSRQDWYPTGDLAYAELRLQGMPRHIPLLGTAGRIGGLGSAQGNHPGPLMFWAMWPFYAVLGRSSWAMEAATIIVNFLWVAAATWMAGLRLGRRGLAVFVVVVLGLFWAFGLDALSQPWNPWLSLYPFLALVVAVWLTLDGRRWAPIVAVVAGSFSVASHVGYAAVALPLVVAALLVPAVRALRQRRAGTLAARWWVPLAVAVGAGVLAWIGPLIDWATADSTNVAKLLDSFASPEEEPVGLVVAVKTVLRTLNPFTTRGSGTTVVTTSPWLGVAFVGTWALLAAVVAARRLDRRLTELNAVLALVLVTTVYGVSRIFGDLYLYVYRWSEVLLGLLVLSAVWGLVAVVRSGLVPLPTPPAALTAPAAPARRALAVGGAVVVLGLAAATSARVARQEIPFAYTWRTEAALAPEVAAALPRDHRYLVTFDDPVYLFGIGFGLVLDLERRGFDVGVTDAFRASIEPHRVRCDGEFDRVLTVASGLAAIDRWRRDPTATEVAEARLRDEGVYEDRLDRLHGILVDSGHDLARDEVEDLIYKIFFYDYEPRAVPATEALFDAGAPTAVFVQDAADAEPVPCP